MYKSLQIYNILTGKINKEVQEEESQDKDEINEELNDLIGQIEKEKKEEVENKNIQNKIDQENQGNNNNFKQGVIVNSSDQLNNNNLEISRVQSQNLRNSLPVNYQRPRSFTNPIPDENLNKNQNLNANPNTINKYGQQINTSQNNVQNVNQYNTQYINQRYNLNPNQTQNMSNSVFMGNPYGASNYSNMDNRYKINNTYNQVPPNYQNNNYNPNVKQTSYNQVIQNMVNLNKKINNTQNFAVSPSNIKPSISVRRNKVEDDPEYQNLMKTISDLKSNKIPLNIIIKENASVKQTDKQTIIPPTNNFIKNTEKKQPNGKNQIETITPSNLPQTPSIQNGIASQKSDLVLPLKTPLIGADFQPTMFTQIKLPIKFKSPEYISLKEKIKQTLSSCEKDFLEGNISKTLNQLENILFCMTKIGK